jgi:hypothetical protein
MKPRSGQFWIRSQYGWYTGRDEQGFPVWKENPGDARPLSRFDPAKAIADSVDLVTHITSTAPAEYDRGGQWAKYFALHYLAK